MHATDLAVELVAENAQLVRLGQHRHPPRFVFLSTVLDALLAARPGPAGRA